MSTLIGVSGCLYAVRASAYRPIEPDLISDFVIAGDVFQRGFITVYGGGAVSSEKTTRRPARSSRCACGSSSAPSTRWCGAPGC